jgi:hypothetical protein
LLPNGYFLITLMQMSKINECSLRCRPYTRCAAAGVLLLSVFLFLAVSVPDAHANGLLSLSNAIHYIAHHNSASSQNLPLYQNPLNIHKLTVIVPEPNFGAITALGGFIGLAAWRLRRRSTRNTA